MKKQKNESIIGIVISLVVVLIGGMMCVGVASGWFDSKVELDSEYYSNTPDFINLNASGYEKLIQAKKSFIVLVDQNGCTTADRIRQYTKDYMGESGINIYKMFFKEVKESSLHDYVKYYPSIVVIDKGRVRAYLKADSDEDAEEYNDYNMFKTWLNQYL